MTQRQKLLVYLWVLHLVAAITAGRVIWLHFEVGLERGLGLLAVELLLPISLWLGHRLIHRLLAPLELAATGAELIAERDFTSTYRTTGRPDTDRLIEVYNRMILELREERLRQQEQEDFLQRLVEASPAGIVLTDYEDRVSGINPKAKGLLGMVDDDGLRDSVGELPSPWGPSLQSLEPRQSIVLSLTDGRRVRCRAGEFRDRGFARRFFLLEELTEELHRSEKAAYDKLLRLVSHEVNNSVAAVTNLLASLDFLAQALEGEERQDAERALAIASERLLRMQSFIESLAQVVRLPAPNPNPVDLDAVLDDLLRLMQPTLEEQGIRVERHRAPKLPAIAADRLQLEQALINVIKNAVEAMAESAEKTLSVSTSLDTSKLPLLEISDTGTGIDRQTAEQLFTPFFTTKRNGCGIGLTLVREILGSHGWRFALEPKPNHGATFSIRFVPD